MKCPQCKSHDSKVTRTLKNSVDIERERRCDGCGWVYATVETIRANSVRVNLRAAKSEYFDVKMTVDHLQTQVEALTARLTQISNM